MEWVAIIFIIWLIGCAFPGSSGGHGIELRMVLVFIVCTALGIAALAASIVIADALFSEPFLFFPTLIVLLVLIGLTSAARRVMRRCANDD